MVNIFYEFSVISSMKMVELDQGDDDKIYENLRKFIIIVVSSQDSFILPIAYSFLLFVEKVLSITFAERETPLAKKMVGSNE